MGHQPAEAQNILLYIMQLLSDSNQYTWAWWKVGEAQYIVSSPNR